MKKIYSFALMGAALFWFAGCSSDDEVIDQGNTEQNQTVATKVVTESGVQEIPLVVTRGTSDVTVKYTSNGQPAEMKVPFTQTSQRNGSSLVSGKVTLYSPTATCVNIFNGNNLVAENVLLTGTQTKAKVQSTSETVGDTDAWFFVRIDNSILENHDWSGKSSELFYPQLANGNSDYSKKGRIYTEGIDWKTSDNEPYYIYSSDGSATAPLLAEIPEFTAEDFPEAIRADFDNYKIIWYVVKKQASESDGWHVDGYLTTKDNNTVTPTTGEDKEDSVIVKPVDPDQPSTDVEKSEDGIYHDSGVMLYDNDGDKDYNDLVVDYDVEARFPKDGNFPYIKIVMHLRALSCNRLDKVSMNFDKLDQYVCAADDMNITFHDVRIQDTPYEDVPDFTDCWLQPERSGDLSISVSRLQWLLNNDNENGWYQLDENGWYNVTNESFNGKPFATLTVMLYPKEGSTEEDIEQAVANILDVARQSFSFGDEVGGEDTGDYIIAPTGTAHVEEGSNIYEAYPNYPNDGWWETFVDENIVKIN